MSVAPHGSGSPAVLSQGRGAKILLAAAALVVAVGALSYAIKPTSGTLEVSASGPHGRALPSVEIYVDSVKRCSTSHCRIEDLRDGVHIVEAKSPGYVAMAGKAVKIEAGEEIPFDLELDEGAQSSPSEAPAPAKAEEKQPEEPAERAAREDDPGQHEHTTSIEDLKPAGEEARVENKPSAPPANNELARKLAGAAPSEPTPAAPAQPQAGMATLNINSIPASRVVVDGRPLGQTPKVGLKLPPGAHTVVFIHPEHGRKVQRVTLQAGQAQTASVRFP
jgi:hypothetical protein